MSHGTDVLSVHVTCPSRSTVASAHLLTKAPRLLGPLSPHVTRAPALKAVSRSAMYSSAHSSLPQTSPPQVSEEQPHTVLPEERLRVCADVKASTGSKVPNLEPGWGHRATPAPRSCCRGPQASASFASRWPLTQFRH